RSVDPGSGDGQLGHHPVGEVRWAATLRGLDDPGLGGDLHRVVATGRSHPAARAPGRAPRLSSGEGAVRCRCAPPPAGHQPTSTTSTVSAIVAGEPWVRLSPSPGGVKAGPDDLEFGEVVSLPDPELPFEEASMSFSAAGELLVSSLSDATIAAVGADGSVRYLLAPEGSPLPAPVRFPHAVRTSVVALADGRVAFATNAIDGGPGDGEVYVLEGEVLRRVETGTGRLVRRIFPGPDGSLLALDGRNISLLDPDTGEVEVLVDLTELDYVGPPGPRESPWLLTRE